MWIQENGKKYRLGERYKDPLTDKLKIITIQLKDKRKSTIKEAKIALTNEINRRINQVKRGKIVRGVTLERAVTEYMEDYKKRVKRATYYNHVFMQKRLLSEFGDDTLIENLTAKIIKKKLEGFMYGDNKMSSQSASRYKYYLHQILDYAIDNSYLETNPVNDVELDYVSLVSSNQIENKFLESDELDDFLDYAYAKNETYAQLCEWLYLTGSRIGEATSLDFKDVYKKKNHWIVDINGTLDYDHVKIKNQKKSESPKTVHSIRTVILPQKAVDIYKRRIEITGGKGFIFCTSHGTPIQTSAMNTFLRTAKKNLKMDKPLSSHIFRHTHISKLAELGVPLYVIQKRVGHGDSKITKGIYLHVTQKAIEKEAPKLDKL